MWIKQASFAGLASDPEYPGSSNPSRADEGKPLPATPEAGQDAVHQDLCHGKTNAWVFAITKRMCNLGMYLPPPPPQDKKKIKIIQLQTSKKNCFQLIETEMACWTINWNIVLEITNWSWHKVLYLQLKNITVIDFNL